MGRYTNFLDTTEYRVKATKLLHDLLVDERLQTTLFDVHESILSFNYTRPVANPYSSQHPIPYVNVHGRLGGKIIFGIDGSGLMSDPQIAPFTKTYRIMALSQPDIGKLVHGSRDKSYRGTKCIKFYGHSLAKANYSYFQAIFDTVGLYDGDTRLIFYYRPYGDKDSSDVQHETMDRAIKLLDAYGNTLDNPAHGRNLIHKLLLEGRLSVKLLPTDNWEPIVDEDDSDD